MRPEAVARSDERRRLVLGLGNPLRGDDGVGGVVVGELRRLAVGGMELETLEGEVSELIEAWAGADRVTVVDASSSGAPVGAVRRFDAARESLPARLETASSHGFGLAEAIELARALGSLPREIEVYAIEGREFAPGAELSDEVLRAAHSVARELAEDSPSA